MSKFQVGERVRISPDIAKRKEHQSFWIVSEMIEEAGKIFTIGGIVKRKDWGETIINAYKLEGWNYTWGEDWLDKLCDTEEFE